MPSFFAKKCCAVGFLSPCLFLFQYSLQYPDSLLSIAIIIHLSLYKKNDSRPIFWYLSKACCKTCVRDRPVSAESRISRQCSANCCYAQPFHHNSSLEALICLFRAYISTVPSESGSQMLRKSIYSLTSRQISSVCTVIGNISTGTISLTPYPFSTSFFTSWACVNGLQEI